MAEPVQYFKVKKNIKKIFKNGYIIYVVQYIIVVYFLHNILSLNPLKYFDYWHIPVAFCGKRVHLVFGS